MASLLAARFAFFREHSAQSADDDTLATLRQLEHDQRMIDAWAIIDNRNPDAFQHVLFTLLESKWKADRVADFPEYQQTLQARYAKWKDAASALLEFADGQKFSIDPELTAPSIQHTANKIAECQQSLIWMKDYIERLTTGSLEALKRDTPSSQKRDAAHVAFAVMFCKTIKDKLGTPLYDFVATAATVVYQLNEEMSVDSVRLAFKRDQEKRATR
jgi:hypothetical protein